MTELCAVDKISLSLSDDISSLFFVTGSLVEDMQNFLQ